MKSLIVFLLTATTSFAALAINFEDAGGWLVFEKGNYVNCCEIKKASQQAAINGQSYKYVNYAAAVLCQNLVVDNAAALRSYQYHYFNKCATLPRTPKSAYYTYLNCKRDALYGSFWAIAGKFTPRSRRSGNKNPTGIICPQRRIIHRL